MHAIEETSMGVDLAVASGTCDDRFVAVKTALEKNLRRVADIGASAAVYIDGEPVVDIWGGYFDEARTRAWERDTIVNNFSTTKTMTALCALVLADRGALDLNAPVARYWPEFAAEGKSGVLVRHLLGHTSGLAGWTEPMTIADTLDHEKASSMLARQAPWWTPGVQVGYHAITFGPLIGEVVRRVTGRSLGRFFAEEIAGPLGGDYHIGTGPECDHRVSVLIPTGPIRPRSGADTISDRAFFNPYVTPRDSGTIPFRRAELGGTNGHGNARSVAAIQSVLACGGEVRGVRLLSRAGCERALEEQADGQDLVCGYPLRWGLGYALENPTLSALYGNRFLGHRIAFWGGSGGSIVVNDFDERMTIAFVPNRHVEHGGIDQRGMDIVEAAYDSLRNRG